MKITDIPITKLHPFMGHPYKVLDDGEMNDLTESVKENGILSPLIVRPLEDIENEYEVISGHRRLHAAERAGMQSVPAFIHEIDRDEAAVLVVDSNLHREHILPSEKAFAYKLKLEALAHQGKTSRQVGEKWSVEQISEPNPYKWCKTTVQKILSQQEYCGDIINFKTYSKSFKNKRRMENDPETTLTFTRRKAPARTAPSAS